MKLSDFYATSDCAGHSRNMGSSHVSASCMTYRSEDPRISFSDRDSGQAKPEGCMNHACSSPLILSKWCLRMRKIPQGCNAARFTNRVIRLRSVSVTLRHTVPAKTPRLFPYLGRDSCEARHIPVFVNAVQQPITTGTAGQ